MEITEAQLLAHEPRHVIGVVVIRHRQHPVDQTAGPVIRRAPAGLDVTAQPGALGDVVRGRVRQSEQAVGIPVEIRADGIVLPGLEVVAAAQDPPPRTSVAHRQAVVSALRICITARRRRITHALAVRQVPTGIELPPLAAVVVERRPWADGVLRA